FIAIDEAQPPPIQRIVCAHELGHHLLHRDLAEQILFNEYELYRMETKVEREANLFACFLLIPDDPSAFFRRPENRDVSVEEAARLFGTTRELLSIRLQAEGGGPEVRVSRFPS
ncbi:MAG: ImmA/IrrE family metallo-endopeptidase, partial [Clostridia bacterium]|nr:ImmA/IrrE family metallo-endopeptidase [Clostridia bacterium]